MTEREKTEIARRARQDAQALRSGWPSRGKPYQQQDEADLWRESFEAALKEWKK